MYVYVKGHVGLGSCRYFNVGIQDACVCLPVLCVCATAVSVVALHEPCLVVSTLLLFHYFIATVEDKTADFIQCGWILCD